MIKTNIIKSTGTNIPSLTLGCSGIGNLYHRLSNTEAINVVEEAIKMGWRSFDVAPHYGSSLAELRLGLALRNLKRNDFILSTKVGRLLMPRTEDGLQNGNEFYDENPFNRVYDYSYDGIMRSYEDSIRRLGTRRIDILYVHDIGKYAHGATPEERKYFKTLCESGFKALEELKKNGQIKAYGIGANETEIMLEAMDYANLDIVLLAQRYNLLEPRKEEFFAKCAKYNVSVAAAAVFASGALVKKSITEGHYEYGKITPQVFKRIQEISKICDNHGVPIGAAALQFPLRNKNVVSVVCGVTSTSQVKKNYEWAQWDIPDELWQDLAAIDIY
ncbi:aldo/keto reductase [Pectinatus cerevisiiphilus]|uniref:D-threo-aldose 1-dehydrogenase n=1 Tax=Pectinatus cerevisiiphilus TaxID=86956 RepID=A0A4R3K6I7_9FIRM|nr:aldo/keto reductase [Pectinatus cerevisiiphilus]TCS78420.1 D-threo-aldose 1-dehydrogenase [Pectinatus cerevisiiphilus]